MRSHLRVLIAILLILLSGCSGHHLITDELYRNEVERSFKKTLLLAHARHEELFSVFEQDLSVERMEGLKYLFAYMPLNDLADYSGSFFLANADVSLAARKETSWGSSIPEDIFLHYVLPVRVNNENLDSFRIVYYHELMNRVHDKSIKEAALEINHWCHEKVTYQPSDSRTSAPMSTLMSARGRCGEESTFTVAALRTAGIPARQVYTPRWAHSDDNHAWVEFWADGTWYYMGACEPEAIPDRGWFTEPARRAMLVHTKAFGAYSGSENILNRFEKYAEINNLAKYAITKKIYVRAVTPSGEPVAEAPIEYQLYNYAEFYPIATVLTDKNGYSSFETGLGDLLIWGRKNDDFGFKKISVGETDTLELIIEKQILSKLSIDLELSVPLKRAQQEILPESVTEANNKRLDNENIIRQQYIDSWMTRSEAVKLASSLNLDTSIVADVIARSMGNYKSIMALIEKTPDSLRSRTLSLLMTIADKDLRDAGESVLFDHVLNSGTTTSICCDNLLFVNYVLNPRISNEILSPWRRFFQNTLPDVILKDAITDPEKIVNLLDTAIRIADGENYSRTPITPSGVWDLKVADTKSRSICFVAICRSLGIPSRLEPGSNIPQYFLNDVWHDVYFSLQNKPSLKKGYVKFTTTDKNPVPEYYKHFTLARFENGRYTTLEYNENTKVNQFSEELMLVPGNYMLVTGNRLNDSKIIANLTFFSLTEGEHKALEIKLPHDLSPPEILGRADLRQLISGITSDASLVEDVTRTGAVLLWIEPDREPSKHVLNDLPLLKAELDAWPGHFLFLNISGGEADKLIGSEVRSGLPSRSFFSDDDDFSLLTIAQSVNKPDFPVVLLINNKGEIIFRSEGYRIGIGEQILKLITIN